jgi:DNA-binding NarL/FixJ family response regulator
MRGDDNQSHSSIRCVVSLHGGFVPAVRRRSLLALTLSEREDISRGIACGSSILEIAKLLDRAASTVSFIGSPSLLIPVWRPRLVCCICE